MPDHRLSPFIRFYLECKKAYPWTFPFGLALVYGICACLVVRQMYVNPDVSILSSIVRSVCLLATMLASAEAVLCTLRRSTDSQLLLMSTSAVALVVGLAFVGFSFELSIFPIAEGEEAQVLVYTVIFVLLVKFDQAMDVSLLDTNRE